MKRKNLLFSILTVVLCCMCLFMGIGCGDGGDEKYDPNAEKLANFVVEYYIPGEYEEGTYIRAASVSGITMSSDGKCAQLTVSVTANSTLISYIYVALEEMPYTYEGEERFISAGSYRRGSTPTNIIQDTVSAYIQSHETVDVNQYEVEEIILSLLNA